MSINKICTSNVVTAPKTASISDAVKLMKKHNIGNIIIVESDDDKKPIGIVTDRDIVLKIDSVNEDIRQLSVDDVMSKKLVTLKSNQSINEAIEKMCSEEVRRAPVVNENGKLCGIITFDDLLVLIAEELNALARLMREQAT